MAHYLDTSALVKLVVAEAETPALRAWLVEVARIPLSSDLARTELEGRGVTDERLRSIDDAVKKRIQEAADFAQTSPEPDESELWTDILVEN